MSETLIRIAEGCLTAIYGDELLPYVTAIREELGLPPEAMILARASVVDPDPNQPGCWLVDLALSGGPVVTCDEAGEPFRTHAAALAYERRWIENRMFSQGLN